MSDATGKVILTTILNGFTHAILPPIGLYVFSKFSEESITSMNAFLALLAFIILMSFLMNFISFTIIQSSVCGKIFNTEHLMRLAGFGLTFSVLFFSLSWHVGFIGNIIRDLVPSSSFGEQMSESITHAFYMFWAGMYAMGSLSWYAAACPPPAIPEIVVSAKEIKPKSS
jgi:hypothetical protein